MMDRYRESDPHYDKADLEGTREKLRRALQKRLPDETEIMAALTQCKDDAVLYDIACSNDTDPQRSPIREKAARMIRWKATNFLSQERS